MISATLQGGASPSAPGPGGLLPIHAAADAGHPAAARLLLEAAPETAAAVGLQGHTPLFLAAQWGHEELVRHAAAARHGGGGRLARNGAEPWALRGPPRCTAVLLCFCATLCARNVASLAWLTATLAPDPPVQVRLLLEAAPAAALISTHRGLNPLYTACSQGFTSIARQLLEAAPLAACTLARDAISQATPLHAAVRAGHMDIVQLILEAQPLAATVFSSSGSLPLHLAAAADHPASAAMVQLLLGAAPGTASTAAWKLGAPAPSSTALHLAATKGNAAAARLLVKAAPQVCLMRVGPQNLLPLEAALLMGETALQMAAIAPGGWPLLKPLVAYLDAARPMLAAMPPELSLPVLLEERSCLSQTVARPLFPDVPAHRPLTAAQWALIPAPCPGLAKALPATLQRSEAEAALLVAHLPAADSARLRTFALALHRA